MIGTPLPARGEGWRRSLPTPREFFRQVGRLHPLIRLAVALWLLLLFGVGGRVLLGPARSHTVVPIYLTAAERWANGEPLYAPAPPLDVYRNPPGFAAAFVPFTWLPERLAGFAWRGLSAAVLLVGLGIWVKRGLPHPLTPGEIGALFSLVAVVAIPSFNNGQTNLIIIGALLLGATAAGSGYGLRAGAWLAAAAAIKVYPAAVGLLLGAAWPRRVLLPFLAAGLVAAAVPFFLQSLAYVLGEHHSFRASVTADDRTFAPLERAPQDAFLALRVWAVPPPPAAYLAVKLAVAAGMAGLVVLAARRANSRSVATLAFHLGCCWITVLGPATEIHTYVLLAPTAASLLVAAFAERHSAGGKLRFLLTATGYCLIVLPILRDTLPGGKSFHNLALPPVGGLLILAAAIESGVRLIRIVDRMDRSIILEGRIVDGRGRGVARRIRQEELPRRSEPSCRA